MVLENALAKWCGSEIKQVVGSDNDEVEDQLEFWQWNLKSDEMAETLKREGGAKSAKVKVDLFDDV